MSSVQETRRTLATIFIIGLGLFLGIVIKRVTIGLIIGLALGLFLSGLLRRK